MDTDVFKNAKPATLLMAAGLIGLGANALYALLNVNAAGFDQLLSSWAFYGLALLVLGASVARPGLVHDERAAWVAACAAFGPGSWARSTTRAAAGPTRACTRFRSPMRCWRRSPCAAAIGGRRCWCARA